MTTVREILDGFVKKVNEKYDGCEYNLKIPRLVPEPISKKDLPKPIVVPEPKINISIEPRYLIKNDSSEVDQ